MAIIPSDDYGIQVDTDAAYPQGKAKNVTVAGDGTGTPLEKGWVNDIWGFLQSLLQVAGITPSGDPDEVGASDYLDALDIRCLRASQTAGYNIHSALDSGMRRDFSSQSTSVRSVSLAGNGLFLSSPTDVYGYIVPQAYNPKSALYAGQTYDLTTDTSSDIAHTCLRVNVAGTRMYSLGTTNNRLYEWTLASPYNVTTASYNGSFLLTGQATSPLKFDVSQDGTKAFVFDETTDAIYRYSMDAWDITTMAYDTGQSLSLVGTDAECMGVAIANDGAGIYTVGDTATETVYHTVLSTPYDLTTNGISMLTFDVSGFTDSPEDLSFSPSGRRMYILEDANDVVAMYYTGNIVTAEDAA